MSHDPNDSDFAGQLVQSYMRLTCAELVPANLCAADQAETVPFMPMSHDASADPLLVNANRTAQRVYGYE